MESALSIRFNSLIRPQQNPFLNFPISKPFRHSTVKIKASAAATNNPVIQNLKLTARAIVFAATAAAVISKFQQYPARAEPTTQNVTPSERVSPDESRLPEFPESNPEAIDALKTLEPDSPEETRLPEFLESNLEAIDALKTLLQEKLEAGEDEEGFKILKNLVSAQPSNPEFKFLMARLLNEMGEIESAREAFEDILTQNPLSFEALFELALLMDGCGEGEAVIKRLEQALAIAEEEKKDQEARDVKMIIAQFQFLQKNIDEALKSYDDLLREDPNDFRPYFCKGMIYSLMDKNEEAKQQFAKYHEYSPKKFEVEGYLRSPLSRMKLFADDEKN